MALKNDFISKLAQPAQRALKQASIANVKDIAKFTEKDLMKLHGIGAKALVEIRKALQESGLSFKDCVENDGK